MRGPFKLILFATLWLVGCQSAEPIDRDALKERYEQTALADGVLSVVPLRLDPSLPPPTVVNWWYAGTSGGLHVLVMRELTWDADLTPVGVEKRYRISAEAITILSPFERTEEASRWVPLYEAAAGDIAPPADLPTTRQAPSPIQTDPIQLPDESVLPAVD